MCRHYVSVLVQHLVRVAVVRREQDLTALCENRVYNLRNELVESLDGLYGRFHDARMPYHVSVCKVQDYHVVFICGDRLENLFGHLRGAHLRLQVVGRDRRRRHENAVLVLLRLLNAAVEEECYVRVLLSLGDTQLLHSQV